MHGFNASLNILGDLEFYNQDKKGDNSFNPT